MSKELTPPDLEQCQAEEGGAFTMGTGYTKCTAVPSTVVIEKRPGPDGKRGSMSLCPECLEAFKKRMPKDFADEDSIIR